MPVLKAPPFRLPPGMPRMPWTYQMQQAIRKHLDAAQRSGGGISGPVQGSDQPQMVKFPSYPHYPAAGRSGG